MTTKYYGVALGGGMPSDVTEGSSTTSLPIELAVVTTTTNLTKEDVLKAVEAISNRIVTDNWPPA